MNCKCEALKAQNDLSEMDMEVYSFEHLYYVEFDARSECSFYQCPRTKIIFVRQQEVTGAFDDGKIHWTIKGEDSGGGEGQRN